MQVDRRDVLGFGVAATVSAFGLSRAGGGAEGAELTPILDFIPKHLKARVAERGNTVDLTPFVQAAIDDGRPLTAGGLDYWCDGQLLIRRNGVNIAGPGRFIWPEDTAVGGAIQVQTQVVGLTLRNLTMTLLRNRAGRAFNGLFTLPGVASVDRFLIEGLALDRFAMGINIETPPARAGAMASGVIRDCRIADTLYTTRIGSGGAHAIYIRGDGRVIIEENSIANMQGGILMEAGGEIRRNRIENAFEDNGIYAPGAHHLTVTGNYVARTRADGIAFNGSEHCTADGNTVVDAGNACLRVQASKAIRITGNRLHSNGRTGHFMRGASSGMDAPTDILFENNICTGRVTANPIAFAEADTLSPYRNIRIVGNTFNDVDTSALNGSFFGPFAIVNVAARTGNRDIIVEDNRFNRVKRIPGAVSIDPYLKGVTSATLNSLSQID